MNNFSTWLNTQFMDWEKGMGRRQTVSAFARYLEVPQPSLSRWLNGDTTPDPQNVLKIALKFGPVAFDILGMKRPANYRIANYIASKHPRPREEGDRIIKLIYQYVEDQKLSSGLEKDELFNKLLAENDFEIISTHYELIDDNQRDKRFALISNNWDKLPDWLKQQMSEEVAKNIDGETNEAAENKRLAHNTGI